MLNTAKFTGDREALKYALRELPVIDEVVRQSLCHRTVVQAGGNLGVFPQQLAQTFAKVVTFEPDPDNFETLLTNVKARNVEAFNAALGASSGRVGLSKLRRDGKTNHHAGIVHVSGDGDITMVAIDDFDLHEVDAIMLDVEGYELFTLEGAVNTIARCRPVICIEINKSLQYVGLTESDVMRFMHDQHYLYVSQRGSDKIFVPSERSTCH